MGGTVVLLLIVISTCFLNIVAYNLPKVEFHAITPRGLRVMMRDDGFTSFTFVGDMRRGSKTRHWDTYVPRAKQGYWVYIDRNDIFLLGDTIIYTISVIKNNRRYQTSGTWTVNEHVSEDEVPLCETSETVTQCSKSICINTLIFSEEFNDADKFTWQKENMFPQEPDFPFNAYSKNTVRVLDGNLIIEPTRTLESEGNWNFGYECTGEAGTRECTQTSSGAQILPPVVSGKVSTRHLFDFKYGRVEVRAKLPVGDWLIPEINLEPLYYEYGKERYGSGLIRIACVKGNDEFSKEIHGGPIVSDTEPYRSTFLKTYNSSSEPWNEDFHVYTLIWEPSRIKLLVDGTLYGDLDETDETIVNTNGNVLAPLDEMFYLSLGVRVGGINDFPDRPNKPWKNGSSKAMYNFWKNQSWHDSWTSPSLIVDYIRVYAL